MREHNYSSARIAKNTIALYIRSFVSMLITLYASRILLKTLGVDDFGIYNVVGGVVMLFSFLNSSLVVSTQRFLNYEMGRGNYKRINDIFCTSVNIQLFVAVGIFIIGEVIGLFVLYNYLSIPEERIHIAFWVLQFSILTLVVNIISVPYNAFIIAKEDMKSFAYIDILNALLKLLVIFIIGLFGRDKLFLYALLILFVQIIIRIIYSIYCNQKYLETKFHFYWEGELMKEMLSFSSWTSLSAITYLLNNYGISILYNIFYGVAINAAIGIANQVNAAILGLVGNFTTSFNPQITKNYASGDWDRVELLHFTGSKFSFFLMSILAAPIILNVDSILYLWLDNVPPHTGAFSQIILCIALITSLTSTSNTLVRSTGRIKGYELILNSIIVFFLILSFVCFKLHTSIYVPYMMLIVSSIFVSFFVAYRSCKCVKVSCKCYLYSVHFRMLMAFVVGMCIAFVLQFDKNGFCFLILNVASSIFIIALCEYLLGFNLKEKMFLRHSMSNLLSKILK